MCRGNPINTHLNHKFQHVTTKNYIMNLEKSKMNIFTNPNWDKSMLSSLRLKYNNVGSTDNFTRSVVLFAAYTRSL